MRLATLVLAAGAGSRFPETPKQLALYGGKPLLTHAIHLAEQASPENVTVVLGCQADVIKAQLNLSNALVHEHWAQGMGSSLAYGVNQLPNNVDAVLILLADQVALKSADLSVLIDRFKAQDGSPKIVCAQYRDQWGVPAIFPKSYFSALKQLKGDKGAKHLLTAQSCIAVPIERAAVDIDTEADLKSANEKI